MKYQHVVAAILLIAASSQSVASNVSISVENIKSDKGQIGCAMFDNTDGFPMTSDNATVIWIDAKKEGVLCQFTHVQNGIYAVSVVHDLNGNKMTDTNFWGIPKEDWGVSNNVRPKMRAPSFEESKFEVLCDVKFTVRIQ